VVTERSGVSILDEVFQVDSARAIRPKAVNRGFERDQSVRPVAAWIGLSQRSADGTPVSHLNVCNPGSAVVQDGNLSRQRRMLNLGVTRHSSEAKCAGIFLDEGIARDEVQVHKVLGVSEAKLK